MTTDEERTGAWKTKLLFLFALHAAASLVHFPPAEIASGRPAITSDYSHRYLEGVRVADRLREGALPPGWSTRQAAGFPDGFSSLVNNKPFCLLLAATPESWRPIAFNGAILACFLLFPLLVVRAASILGVPRRALPEVFLFVLLAWYGSGLFRLFWRGGSVTFAVGAAVALRTVAGLWRDAQEGGMRPGTVAWATLTPWVHPLAAPIVAIGAVAAVAVQWRETGFRIAAHARLGAIVVIGNLPWLVPYFEASALRAGWNYGIYLAGARELLEDFVLRPLHLAAYRKDEAAVLAPLTLLAAWAAWRERGIEAKDRFLALLAVGLALVTYASSPILPELQPYRYAIPLACVLAILAAGSLSTREARPDASPAMRQRDLVRIVVAVAALLVLADRVRSALPYGDFVGTELLDRERTVLAILGSESRAGHPVRRVLLEGDWITERVVGRPWAKRIHYAYASFERDADFEILGAPIHPIGTPQEIASFWKGRFLGRSLAEASDAWILDGIAHYGIDHVVTANRSTLERLQRVATGLRFVAASGDSGVFRVERPTHLVARGSASVAAGASFLDVTTAGSGEVVLRYHWIDGLRVEPPAEITSIRLRDDAPPFLRLRAPAPGTWRIDFARAPNRW